MAQSAKVRGNRVALCAIKWRREADDASTGVNVFVYDKQKYRKQLKTRTKDSNCCVISEMTQVGQKRRAPDRRGTRVQLRY